MKEIYLSKKETKFKTHKGYPMLGIKLEENGANFGLFTRNGLSVSIEIYENYYDDKPIFSYVLDKKNNKTGDIWHVFIEDIHQGMCYGWRVDGPYKPEEGYRFNKHKLLLDPYAKIFSGKLNFSDECIYGYNKTSPEKDLSFNALDSAKSGFKSTIWDTFNYNWEEDEHPRYPLNDLIIYEMHIRLFTMSTNSQVEHRGTYKGLIEKIDYLKELGINAVELMPIFAFDMEDNPNINPITGEKLKNVWGYNPISFFATTSNYRYGLKVGDEVIQFQDLVKNLHKNKIEVILDVVYNHTAEGNELGPTLNFRGLENSVYYLLKNDNKRYYENFSGTGNTINSGHYVVKQMILDSLRFWVSEMHVDGFRFDLASILGRDFKGNWVGDLSLLKDIADDPLLAGTHLIAEGWDAAGGYYVGDFPTGWAEWNGKFRDTVRKFVRGDEGTVADLATRIAGSPDLFEKRGRKPYHSVNFITSHDGFTMWDLVSYNNKHNEANGENNQDGTNANYSYNYGIEGETDDEKIIRLRKKQIKNFITILMVSQGLPMILMGDEFCRTQFGNNNAYCQDNYISWVDWSRKEKFKDVFEFTKNMIEFRKKHCAFRRDRFFTGKDINGNGIPDITWHGVKPFKPDFGYYSKSLAFMISGEDIITGCDEKDNDIYVALNAFVGELTFEIPKLPNRKRWYRVVDTSKDFPDDFLSEPIILENNHYQVSSRSSIILISK
ncbi:glycogen debranching protein GlgX [Petrotoga sp. 9PWA.NaAc.5.4]|uniref:glycogen debranching protein GlgX n=1 Tax=Petrotoga sp. 9PWA.NaAc.5.4 TaxID=1434328 RepID=UPI000CAA7049|nr:glycogen debranching protein GlgX [Petrotoga sp. 9PWA.NaAc.5.4]PNR92797.1 glycogen operon protein glgX-2 [Petrotoga sp. 9PWA.NaAc.5.4]